MFPLCERCAEEDLGSYDNSDDGDRSCDKLGSVMVVTYYYVGSVGCIILP